MLKGLIGKKIGMTQIFDDQGVAYPVTLIEAGPCYVTQVRKPEKEGYSAVQLGFSEVHPKRLTNGELGHLNANKIPPLRFLREFRAKTPDVNIGDKVTVAVFAIGEHVDVVGVSKGQGICRCSQAPSFPWNGCHPRNLGSEPRPGSNSSGTTPGRVYRGSRRAGHMGMDRVTAQNLKVVMVDAERNLIGVHGAVPGGKGSLVVLNETRKQ